MGGRKPAQPMSVSSALGSVSVSGVVGSVHVGGVESISAGEFVIRLDWTFSIGL
jgi:hypothetical protein